MKNSYWGEFGVLFNVLALVFFILVASGELHCQSPLVEQYYFQGPSSLPNTGFNDVFNGGVLKGVTLRFDWNSIESNSGINVTPDTWTTFDALINSYISTYPTIKIGIVFSPATDINSNSGTPSYVLQNVNQHTCFCSAYPGDGGVVNNCVLGSGGGTNLTGIPDPMDAPFQAAYWGNTNSFIRRARAHLLAASYLQSIRYVVFGFQRGGENFPTCDPLEQAQLNPNTKANLKATWNAGNDAEDKVITETSVSWLWLNGVACIGNATIPSAGNNCDLGDLEAQTHSKYGIGLRLTLLQDADRANFAAGAYTASAFFNDNTKYAVPMDAQEGQESSPVAGQCTSKAGSWTTLLPFLMQHWGLATVRIHEGLSSDWRGAYSSSFTDTCWPANFVTNNGGYPYAPYDSVLKNMARGLPSGAVVIQ